MAPPFLLWVSISRVYAWAGFRAMQLGFSLQISLAYTHACSCLSCTPAAESSFAHKFDAQRMAAEAQTVGLNTVAGPNYKHHVVSFRGDCLDKNFTWFGKSLEVSDSTSMLTLQRTKHLSEAHLQV